MNRSLAAWLIVPIAASASLGQDAAPLAGPHVAPAPAAPTTIIERDFDGRVKIPEIPPEEAALAVLGLDAAAMAKARAVLDRRGGVLDEFVLSNVPLLTALGAGGANKMEQAMLAHKAFTELAALREGGTLQQQIAAALPEAAAARYNRVLRDFWNAVVASRAKTPKADGKLPNRFEIVAGVKMESLGREIERTFRRVYESGELVYRYVTKGLTLREDQAGKLRQITAEFMKNGGAEGNSKDAGKTFLVALSILDENQRPIFVANLKALGGK